jgi:HAD superfamily hydrolase (TIGR01459 family)
VDRFRVRHNLSEIVADYEVFLLDLWGVVHDGTSLYPDVTFALEQLQLLGKQVWFLSNAPRRSAKIVAQLTKFGVAEHLYQGVITSGEVTLNAIIAAYAPQPYIYIGPARDDDLLSTAYSMTEDPTEAGFAVVTGFYKDDSRLDKELRTLSLLKQYNLPLYCANPDIMVIKQSGERFLCAGVIAQEYSKIGGQVYYFGKPYTAIYDVARKAAGSNARIITIGDGVETDIKGAALHAIDAMLITGGILQLQSEAGEQLQLKLTQIFADHKLEAVPVMDYLRW